MQSILPRSDRPYSRARNGLRGLAILSVALLAACGTLTQLEPTAARPCPQVRVLGDAEQITVFRDGPGRDVLDIEYEAQIIQLAGECIYRKDGTISITFAPAFRVSLGAADTDRQAEFEYFVAIIRRADNTVLNKAVFNLAVSAPPGQSQLRFRDGEVDLSIPLREGENGAAFQVLLGLQLTEAQLEYNRRQAAGRR